MSRVYALHPVIWDETLGCHRPPDGSKSFIDFRPEAEQSKRSQSSGYCFTHWDSPAEVPAEAVVVGTGDCREYQPTVAERDELKLKLGLASRPSGTFLTDCISDVLGPLSDPTGQNGPKPLMPYNGSLEINLAGHSVVYSLPFDFQELLKASPNSRANRIRDVIRANLTEARKSSGPTLTAKVLGNYLKNHAGFTDQQIDNSNSFRRLEWMRLISPQDLALLGVNFKPVKPATSYTDNFNRSDASSLGSDWTTYLSSAEYGISSNQCIFGKASTWGSGAYESARFNYDVSSTDHWANISLSSFNASSSDSWLGSVVRFSSSANTGYSFCLLARTTLATNVLYKIVAGTATSLTSEFVTNNTTETVRTLCSGSSIKGYRGGLQRVSVTDTSITSGTRGGLTYRSTNFAYRPLGDNFLVDDGISSGLSACLSLLGVGS